MATFLKPSASGKTGGPSHPLPGQSSRNLSDANSKASGRRVAHSHRQIKPASNPGFQSGVVGNLDLKSLNKLQNMNGTLGRNGFARIAQAVKLPDVSHFKEQLYSTNKSLQGSKAADPLNTTAALTFGSVILVRDLGAGVAATPVARTKKGGWVA
jgi:hypothetical protein